MVHLTVPLRLVRRSPVPWLRLYRRDTSRTRRSTISGLPVTDVPRTIFDCMVLLDDAGCAALLDHATATLTSDRAPWVRYREDIGLQGSPRVARQLASLAPGAASAPGRTCWWRTDTRSCGTQLVILRPDSNRSSTRSPEWSPATATGSHDHRI